MRMRGGPHPGQDPRHRPGRYGHAAGRGALPVDMEEDPGAAAARRTVVVEADDQGPAVLRRIAGQPLGLTGRAVRGRGSTQRL